MFDLLKLLELLLKITGNEEKVRELLHNINPAEVVFKDFIHFGSEGLLTFSWDSAITYIWVVFFAIFGVAFYNFLVGDDKMFGLFSDYVYKTRNRRLISLIPESALAKMDVSSQGFMMVIIRSIINPWIYLGVAAACSMGAIQLMGDAIVTALFESFIWSPLLTTVAILEGTDSFIKILVIQIIITILGLYSIPLIEAGKSAKIVFASGAERFFWWNLSIPFFVALCYNISMSHLGGNAWYDGILAGGFMAIGHLIPWAIWLGSWLETIIQVIVELVLLILASQGVPVGPVQKALKAARTYGVTKSVMNYGKNRVARTLTKDQRTRPSQMDEPVEGTVI